MPARGERRGRTDVEPQRPSESNLTRWKARLGSQCSSPSRAPSQSTRRRKPKVRLGRNVRARLLFHRRRDSRDRPWSGQHRRLGANSALEDKGCGERQAGKRRRELASSRSSGQQQLCSCAGYSREALDPVRASARSSWERARRCRPTRSTISSSRPCPRRRLARPCRLVQERSRARHAARQKQRTAIESHPGREAARLARRGRRAQGQVRSPARAELARRESSGVHDGAAALRGGTGERASVGETDIALGGRRVEEGEGERRIVPRSCCRM